MAEIEIYVKQNFLFENCILDHEHYNWLLRESDPEIRGKSREVSNILQR